MTVIDNLERVLTGLVESDCSKVGLLEIEDRYPTGNQRIRVNTVPNQDIYLLDDANKWFEQQKKIFLNKFDLVEYGISDRDSFSICHYAVPQFSIESPNYTLKPTKIGVADFTTSPRPYTISTPEYVDDDMIVKKISNYDTSESRSILQSIQLIFFMGEDMLQAKKIGDRKYDWHMDTATYHEDISYMKNMTQRRFVEMNENYFSFEVFEHYTKNMIS